VVKYLDFYGHSGVENAKGAFEVFDIVIREIASKVGTGQKIFELNKNVPFLG